MTEIEEKLLAVHAGPLRAGSIETLQLNLGYKCNMTCKHCHLDAGPTRTELMDSATIDEALMVLRDYTIDTLDLTGGAPELNPHLRDIITAARRIGSRIIVRSNLTIFYERGMEDLPDFYIENKVDIIASLQNYS